MPDPIFLSLCDRSTVMAQPWAEAGFECWCVDIQHPEGEHRDGNIIRVGADLHHWLPPRRDYIFCAAFPPCTHLAVSGARWFKDKGIGKLVEGLALVERCRLICEWTGAPWMLENPVGTISSYWRKPDHTFQPWNFGDDEQKKTCLWVGGGFVMPDFEVTECPADVRQSVWRMAPGDDRGDLRSVTFAGFARAVFEANVSPHPQESR